MSQALDPVTQHHVRQAADALGDEFGGVFSRETIERYIAERVVGLSHVMPGDGVEGLAHDRLLGYRPRSMRSVARSSMRVNIQVVKTIATVTATCPPLLAGALPPAAAEDLARALRVIADPARLRILSLIQAQPEGEACVCHLTEPLGLTQPTVSHHLKVLLDAGLVEREQRGSWAYFRVVGEQLAALRELLA